MRLKSVKGSEVLAGNEWGMHFGKVEELLGWQGQKEGSRWTEGSGWPESGSLKIEI